jgi:thiamine monophosphate kinase
MGRVTAIDESKFTLLGADSTSHEFKTVEATSFSKQRQAVSLADIRVEDVVRVEGALKDGSFVAASVTVMSMSVEKPPVVPREATPAPEANAKQAK